MDMAERKWLWRLLIRTTRGMTILLTKWRIYPMLDTDRHDHTKEAHSLDELGTLLDISQSLHKSINLDDLLVYIVAKAKELMSSETVAVILHDAVKDELLFRTTEGNPEENACKLKEIRFPSHQGIAGTVFTSGKPELIEDVPADFRHYRGVDDKTRFETKSMVAVPLRSKDRIIGVIEACNKRQGKFDETDLRRLTMIANTVAMALDNARIHSELECAYKELQLINKNKDNLIEVTKEENVWLRREIEDRYRFDHIKGNSPQMLDVFRLCEKVMGSDITVLIEGETGTGKELIARCLHFNGPRKDKRFVTQNCGSIPESLLASELFGHKRGAFTGAISDKKGLFETAHGGTVFLDEVAEMSAAMQVSLLRTLQEGEIKPLGSDLVKRVDVRMISATNRNLEDDVKKGTFREDLYYRLNVFTVKLPPLRERTDDIPILAGHFVEKFCRKTAKPIRGLSNNALECLCSYPFPGNIRELENEMERAVVLAEAGKNIEIFHLSEKVRSNPALQCGEFKMRGKLRDMTESLEKQALAAALEECGGNKTLSAKRLGLSRFGLLKKIKRYGL
jgi:Nif-specific regulatory protein